MSSPAISPASLDGYRRRSDVVQKRSLLEDKLACTGKSSCEATKGAVTSRPRTKPAAAAPSWRRWRRILSVASKFLTLLAVLLWLGSTAWTSWQHGRRRGYLVGTIGEYEARIADVEASMKTQITMLQLQLDIVDKKIANEVGSVSYQMRKLVESERIRLEKELQKLEAKADGLDKSLQELKMADLITRSDFDNFLKEVEKMMNSDRSESTADLDQVRALAKELTEKEIAKHAADGLGRLDYALASSGGQVVRHSLAYGFGKGTSWLGWSWDKVHGNAAKMLQPSFGEPGQCFALHGSSGFVEIQLITAIVPEAVTLEHVHKSVAYDRSSAPKDCRVFGWYDGPDADIARRNSNIHPLVEFSYDLEKSNAQTFDINATEDTVVNMIRLDFDSNQGNSLFTCIYRFRVHGRTPGSPLALES